MSTDAKHGPGEFRTRAGRYRTSYLIAGTTVVLAALFSAAIVVRLGANLPPTFPTPFRISEAVESSIARTPLVGIVLLVTSVLPVFMWLWQVHDGRGGAMIPDAEYWYSPPKCEETICFLDFHAAIFSVAFTSFLSFAFWILVSDASSPAMPLLKTAEFGWAFGAFLAFVAGWVVWLQMRFRRPA